jgi:DNA-binding response OmpR family regulator
MICILLVSSNYDMFNNLKLLLNKYNNVQIIKSEDGNNALTKIKRDVFDLVIIDESLNDMSGFELAKMIVSKNPFINCAIISGLSKEQFHETSEGLGLLMQLPYYPNNTHIENLLSNLKTILNKTSINHNSVF